VRELPAEWLRLVVSVIRGDGGMTVTLGKELSESWPGSSGASTLVVMKEGTRTGCGFGATTSGLGLGGSGGGLLLLWTDVLLLRGLMALPGLDGASRERSRLWWFGDAPRTNFDRKLGAITFLYLFLVVIAEWSWPS
jgi:hypothetical protein